MRTLVDANIVLRYMPATTTISSQLRNRRYAMAHIFYQKFSRRSSMSFLACILFHEQNWLHDCKSW